MAKYNKDRNYWCRLYENFFDTQNIRLVEAMQNGVEYAYFYTKLITKSLRYGGALRLSDAIAYTDQMLAVITNVNIDIVRSALKVFQQLRMIEILEDGTYFLPEVDDLIGSSSFGAEKKQAQRRNHAKMLAEIGEKTGVDKGVDKCPPEIRIKNDTDDDDDDINQACACEDADPECQFFFDAFSEHVKDIKDEMPIESQRLQSCVDYVQDKGTVMINGTKHRAAEVISVLLWYTVPSNKDKLVEILTHIDDKSAEITNQLTYTTIALYNGARASGAMPGTRRE